jgi:hypothetical protein
MVRYCYSWWLQCAVRYNNTDVLVMITPVARNDIHGKVLFMLVMHRCWSLAIETIWIEVNICKGAREHAKLQGSNTRFCRSAWQKSSECSRMEYRLNSPKKRRGRILVVQSRKQNSYNCRLHKCRGSMQQGCRCGALRISPMVQNAGETSEMINSWCDMYSFRSYRWSFCF